MTDRTQGNAALCTGSSECEAVTHIHGCFADKGNCDHPSEHRNPLADEMLAKMRAARAATTSDAAASCGALLARSSRWYDLFRRPKPGVIVPKKEA